MVWRVDVGRRARRWLRRHPQYKERVYEAFRVLERSPYMGKRLTGRLRGKRSYRVGKVRIIYTIDERLRIVYVEDIEFRESVYKKKH